VLTDNYAFLSLLNDEGIEPPQGRWRSGESFDGNSQFTTRRMRPEGQELNHGLARPNSGAQAQQIEGEDPVLEDSQYG